LESERRLECQLRRVSMTPKRRSKQRRFSGAGALNSLTSKPQYVTIDWCNSLVTLDRQSNRFRIKWTNSGLFDRFVADLDCSH
jgi:hypothetical protein